MVRTSDSKSENQGSIPCRGAFFTLWSILNKSLIYQMCATISTLLLKIFSFSTFSMSAWFSPVYEMSSHSSLWSPSRSSEIMSVVTSFATKLSLFNLMQFRQIAKNPSFWTPVPPINNSSISFKNLPIDVAPFDLMGFLIIGKRYLEMCSIFI